ncbi:hypothetical protein [Psychrobacillus phage Perkons]|nr:hypothetical protein [Psychrobacillus phage Perkons]
MNWEENAIYWKSMYHQAKFADKTPLTAKNVQQMTQTIGTFRLTLDFKKTQPRKKRQNLDKAFRKLNNGERLNTLEWEACQKFQDFILNY